MSLTGQQIYDMVSYHYAAAGLPVQPLHNAPLSVQIAWKDIATDLNEAIRQAMAAYQAKPTAPTPAPTPPELDLREVNKRLVQMGESMRVQLSEARSRLKNDRETLACTIADRDVEVARLKHNLELAQKALVDGQAKWNQRAARGACTRYGGVKYIHFPLSVRYEDVMAKNGIAEEECHLVTETPEETERVRIALEFGDEVPDIGEPEPSHTGVRTHKPGCPCGFCNCGVRGGRVLNEKRLERKRGRGVNSPQMKAHNQGASPLTKG